MRVLLITAVEAELSAALPGATPVAGLPYRAVSLGPCIGAAVGAVGPVAAAVHTSRLLGAVEVDLVVSAGLGGGFSGRSNIGDLVLASWVRYADLGAATDDGFLPAEDMGFAGGSALVPVSLPDIPGAVTGG